MKHCDTTDVCNISTFDKQNFKVPITKFIQDEIEKWQILKNKKKNRIIVKLTFFQFCVQDSGFLIINFK